MKVRLIPINCKIPNLALMKLSAYHKSLGDQVSLDEPDPDLVYVSSPFSSAKGTDYSQIFPEAKIEYGGYGFNNKKLPDNIEHLMPDYSIFNCDYSMGYTTRGCINKCHFCIAPKMEGYIQKWAHPSEFWNQDHNKIMFLDNNILSLHSWFMETSQWLIDHDLTLLLPNGLDIRQLNHMNIKRIRELNIETQYRFAFDSSSYTHIIIDKIKLLKEHGFDLKHEVSFYVYLDSNSDRDFQDALQRCKILKEQGTNSFIMFNINQKRSHRVKLLQRWANRRWHYWACDFENYIDHYKKKSKKRKPI